MGKLLENATKMTALAALAIYGIVRVGIDAFYGRLGIPAEDVGVTQATIVSRAAVSFFIAIVVTAMLAAVLTAPMTSWTRRRLEKGRSSGTQPGHSTPVVDTPNLETFSYIVAWLCLFVFGAALLFSTLLDRGEGSPISGPIATGLVAVLITTAVVLMLTLPALSAYVRTAREDPAGAEARIQSLMWVYGVVATLIGTLALLGASYVFGDESEGARKTAAPIPGTRRLTRRASSRITLSLASSPGLDMAVMVEAWVAR